MNLTIPNPIYQFSSFEVQSSGHEPNESVTLNVYYDPNMSGQLPDPDQQLQGTADANGDVTFQVTMPESLVEVISFSTQPDGWEWLVTRHVIPG